MKKFFFHNFLVILVVFLSVIIFNFSTVDAKNGKRNLTLDKEKLSSTLVLQAKNAVVAGNIKLAESYWQRARAMDPSLPEPNWLIPDYKENTEKLPVIDEIAFVAELKKNSYEKAKSDLDKRLSSNPDNNNLRLVYMEIAEANDDKVEANRQREILGLQPTNTNQGWLVYAKYVLILTIAGLIIAEIIIILKTSKKEPKLPPHIRSI